MSAYIKEYKNKFRMDDWKMMRRNNRAYTDFYKYFLPCMVGQRKFKQSILTLKEGHSIATVSDEAMTLLGLENAVDIYMFEKSGGQLRVIPRNETCPASWKTDVHTKYTATDNEKDPKKWSIKGIERFNEIRKMVTKDRQKHGDFEVHWLRTSRLNMVDKKTNKPVEGYESDNMVDADDDFDDERKMEGAKNKGYTACIDDSEGEDSSDSEAEDA
jgi:hypothetical protein